MTTEPQDGGALMAAGDDEAFTAFVAGAHRSLQHVAWLMTGDVDRAEELVQDALVRTYAVWRRVHHQDPFGYTRRVLINANIDSWRRRRREQLVEQPPEPSDAVADVAEAVDQRTTVIRAMRALAPRERAVVVLRYYLDLSEADTAAELGVTVGTVKSTASRALAKLRVTNAASTPGPSEAEGDNVRVPSGPRRDLS